jgi:ABC-2 type transport system ATP-binding protein
MFKRLSEEHDLGEVIEFGCGTGYFTKAIAKNAHHVLATDLSDEMLEAAKVHLEEFQNVTLQKADCESTSYPSGNFDTVLMANLLHVVEYPLKVLRESRRILKDGGLLIVVSYTDYGMNWFEKMQIGIRYLLTFGMPPLWGLRNFSPDELQRLVEGIEFDVEELQFIRGKAGAIYLKAGKTFSKKSGA